MTRHEVNGHQRELASAARRCLAESEATQEDVARGLGYDRSILPRWLTCEAPLPAHAVATITAVTGRPYLLEAIVAEAGYRVAPDSGAVPASVRGVSLTELAVDLVKDMASFGAAVVHALADGVLTRLEACDLCQGLGRVALRVDQFKVLLTERAKRR